jgi:hypothetical protein
MYDVVRKDIVAFVDADFRADNPSLQLVHDNAPFDWNNPPERFVEFEIGFYDAEQVSLGAQPRTRERGWVYVTAYGRAGTGTNELLAALGWFREKLKYANVAGTQFEVARPVGTGTPKRGWFTQGLKVEFTTAPT